MSLLIGKRFTRKIGSKGNGALPKGNVTSVSSSPEESLDFESATKIVANWCSKEPSKVVHWGNSQHVVLQSIPQLSSKDQLFFYARYKQVHQGDNSHPRPSKAEIRAWAKHDAWSSLRGMPPDLMREEYVEKVQALIAQHAVVQGKSLEKNPSKKAGLNVKFFRIGLRRTDSGSDPEKDEVSTLDLREQIVLSTMHKMGLEDDPNESPIGRVTILVDYLRSKNIYPYFVPTRKVTSKTVEVDIGDGVYRECRVFSSCSYLGLIDHPALVNAARNAIDQYGVGAHAVRALGGNSVMHQQLERKIASFSGKEAAVVFTSGYMANIGLISTLCRQGDYILLDKKAHRSLQDACMLSKATLIKFQHNNLEHCAEFLRNGTIPSVERRAATRSQVYLVSDSVFSMDGHLFPLPEGHAFCKKHGIILILDECHSLGVIGRTGRGIEEHFNMPGTVDILTGTLNKAIPASGGYIASSKKIATYILSYGNPLVFSGPLVSSQAAVALEALNILESKPQIVRNLQDNALYFKSKLLENGFDIGITESAVIPLIIGEETKLLEIWRCLLDHGFFTSAVTAPAVATGEARLRLIAHAGMTRKDVDDFMHTLLKLNCPRKRIQVIDQSLGA